MTKKTLLIATLVSGIMSGAFATQTSFTINQDLNSPLSYKKDGKYFVPLVAEVELDEAGNVKKIVGVQPLKTKLDEVKKIIHLMIAAELKKQAKKKSKTLDELVKEEEVFYNILKAFAEGSIKIGEGIFLTAYVAGKYVVIPVTKKTIEILGKAGSKLGKKGSELKNAIHAWYDKNHVSGGNENNPIIID